MKSTKGWFPHNVAGITFFVVLEASNYNVTLLWINYSPHITFLFVSGMITSGFVWGFLADTLGRKKLLIIGYFLDAVMVFCSAFSQSFEMLATFKFLGGFMLVYLQINATKLCLSNISHYRINGPFAVFTSYLSEFHSAKYRTRIQMMLGMIYNVANIILPFMAWIVYSQNPHFEIFNYFSKPTNKNTV